ncbi:unnamed protein product [Schistocephalus solidus]|uniref:Tudor domain-containing protein n=1 Tax=Schistocephalus solidus TaxID=70667 RepID=A0A183SB97_SCHSO|nr:unnamed protein product [Schistocephalus solidus]
MRKRAQLLVTSSTCSTYIQLSDAEAGAAAGDLVNVYYVHEDAEAGAAASDLAFVYYHGVDAEDSGWLQDFRVRHPVLPSQLQYSEEAAEMEGNRLPGSVRADGSGLRSVKECR